MPFSIFYQYSEANTAYGGLSCNVIAAYKITFKRIVVLFYLCNKIRKYKLTFKITRVDGGVNITVVTMCSDIAFNKIHDFSI